MKTIKRDGEVKRVSDKEAQYMVKNGWEYCPKNVWKSTKEIKPKVEVDTIEINENVSDKKKRKLRKENKRKKYDSKQ